ncbi:hypothetical protein HD553DRAFT_316372 [Filobasidium floriforme]|uniref:uncharacterized protein n=1 Tax=Filobasidium floriforme TaxID=5210 RepID=UPI001E8DA008|nr:uncharacterized protein HD553DRAFT_316372 [Filobasidium floriforme]KAH8080808.1 hypothetical protein HD553DRAFT_316372 [Filobasidium floriforme]
MAKKSNAKRSKSGTKTPNREPGASRPASPEPQGKLGEEDEPQGEDQVKTEETTVEEKEAVEVEGTVTADATSETRSSQQVEAANEEDELEEPTKVNGTAGHHADDESTGAQADNEDKTTKSSPVDGTAEAVKNGVGGIDPVPEAASSPAEGVVAESTGTEEKEAQTDTQEDTVARQEDASVTADVDQRIREAEVEAETEDNNGEAAEGDEAGEEESEGDDEDQEQDRIQALESELAQTVREKEHLSTQYRTLLGKLQAMRNSLGEKLKEDAEELDRREVLINQLTTDLQATQATVTTVQSELASLSQENASLDTQLSQLRLENQQKNEQDSSDVVALTRELRELRGDLERVRMEREEWEEEAGREREKRERLEEERRGMERKLIEAEERRNAAEDGWRREEKRASNLEEVLGEFQGAKDLEIAQATNELESQLRFAASSLAEYKSRAADAENRLSNLQNDAGRSAKLDKELKDKTAMIGKLRHDSVVMQEHLTEALRRLRRNTSETNVDRRLVTNILLQFIVTPRADPKRFEMLSLLATILSWEDGEREKAGLQRVGGGGGPSGLRRKTSETGSPAKSDGKGKEKENAPDTYNESFSNLFVEFLLKEAAQGQKPQDSNPSSSHGSPHSPPGSIHPGTPATERGATTPGGGLFGFARSRTYSTASMTSTQAGGMRSPPYVGSIGRKGSGRDASGNSIGLIPMSPRASEGMLSPPGHSLLSPDLPGPRR